MSGKGLIFYEFGTIIIAGVYHWPRSFGTEPQWAAWYGYRVANQRELDKGFYVGNFVAESRYR